MPHLDPIAGCGICATYGGIHAMKGNPTGRMGLQDYLGVGWTLKIGLPIVNAPGCPVQPVDCGLANIRAVNPGVDILQVSTRTGEGTARWYDWLRRQMAEARETAFG